MMQYKERVKLLVQVLHYVAEEKCFALKGGTAINLFYRDFPRISVDIDLTYVYLHDRKTAFNEINKALGRIKSELDKAGFKTKMTTIVTQQKKLFCYLDKNSYVKVEPNYITRGCYLKPREMPLADKVQDILESFALINVVSFGELYGEKICAALDRQHPRDLFDCRILFKNEGFNEEVKQGFILSLLGCKRPLHEILKPNLQNREKVFNEEFEGMTEHPFSYADHVKTFHDLLKTIHKALTQADKEFLLSFVKLEHNWEYFDIANIQDFPAIKWKIQNLQKLKTTSPQKFEEQCRLLEMILS